ncbi:MAG: amidohydrolase [Chloroflexi bacterium]|nr:amidohydrolase [Chloroflexota bacterium]
MIVDCHTHLGRAEQYGRFLREALGRSGDHRGVTLDVTPERHWAAMASVDRAIVFGINAVFFDMRVPNEEVASYVATHPDKLIGFMSVDPGDPGALDQLEHAAADLHLRGIKMSPVYQNYHPLDPRAQRIYRRAQCLGLPILVHAARQGTPIAPMKYANPILFDEVAQLYPDLTIVLAHLGNPWIGDAMVVIRKHRNVYADLAACVKQPWWLYNALVMLMENGALDRVLFGSDFPFSTVEESLAGLREINDPVVGTRLPKIPDEAIETLIHRDTVALLGLT